MSISADNWDISAAREALELPESGFVSPWEERQIESVASALRAERKKVAARCAEMAQSWINAGQKLNLPTDMIEAVRDEIVTEYPEAS